MTPKEVQERVREIEGSRHDDEVAHSEEDELYRDVLHAIAEGRAEDPAAVAKAALKTGELDFARWCA